MKNELGKSRNRGQNLPIRQYIRMEITSDDSLRIAAHIILIIIALILMLTAISQVKPLLILLAEQASLRLKTAWDAAGYAASLLVIVAFCMQKIISLRAIAILSNLSFLTYGFGLGLEPVWLLHAVLLPINCWRLKQALLRRRVERSGYR